MQPKLLVLKNFFAVLLTMVKTGRQWTTRRSNQSVPKEIKPEYSLEGLMLKLQHFGYLMWRADSLEKTDAGKDWRQKEKGMTEDEMRGWHHWLDGHEFEQGPGDGEGQGSLACCSPWGRKESDMTEQLNNNNRLYQMAPGISLPLQGHDGAKFHFLSHPAC